ncbi:MAG TPA: methyltransferase domain-containing protein [Blastocatellia bacterium]|jgi:ubiquinone/menaquinone biosynthesis C-methylase UbiE
MKEYDISTYGESVAPSYDAMYPAYDEAMITTLTELARGGRALELGIGTGRVALPLKEKGIEVHGIDASPSMIEKLRAKPGGENILVTMGNFADVAIEGEYQLVYVVFNTFFALLMQEEQLRCFERVAPRLSSGGAFVIEAFVPDQARFIGGQSTRAVQVTLDRVRLDVAMHDGVSQLITAQHVHITEQGIKLIPIQLRYAWPSEMDLMARLAGLKLRARWDDWTGKPFTAENQKHISVYERAV